jgi:Contractile injection system tube protein
MASATLRGLFPVPGEVTFDFNPDQITVSRQNSMKDKKSSKKGGNSPRILKGSPSEIVSLKKIVLDGEGTQDKCELIMSWMTPKGGLLGALIGGAISMASSMMGGPAINLATQLPRLMFMYGTGLMFMCQIEKSTIQYTRFNDAGNVIRAEITDLKLGKVQSPLDLAAVLPTNPSSGGAPGRRSHMVTAGENLQFIATANYGAPRHWRAVAQTNGIDDPLRVHPGRHLYLPNVEELGSS